jgi:hypothetical protein
MLALEPLLPAWIVLRPWHKMSLVVPGPLWDKLLHKLALLLAGFLPAALPLVQAC